MKIAHASPAEVDSDVLRWAMDRAECSVDDLAKAVGTRANIVNDWLTGSGKPSFRQSRAMAARLRLPFGYLFLPSPPPQRLPIPDFRTIDGRPVDKLSPDLGDVVLATMRRQSWLSEYRRQLGNDRIPVVGRAMGSTSIREVASDIKRSLGLASGGARPATPDAFLRLLVGRVEDLGVLVARSGVVGNNTHRKLNVHEFRGFTIVDDYAPFIFINAADAKQAQIFTLVHELSHVWLGQSGISGSIEDEESSTESFCNRVAAEVLVPADEFQSVWDSELDVDEAVQVIARRFRVSRYVAAIRAYESGLLEKSELQGLLSKYQQEGHRGTQGDGGDFYATTIARNSRTFTEGVVAALQRNQVLIRDASNLLSVHPGNLSRLATELHRRG